MSVARSISAQPPASDADLLLGMGRGTGARHTDQQGSADVGILCHGTDHLQPRAVRSLSAHGGQNRPRGHELRRRSGPADLCGHCCVHTVAGAVVLIKGLNVSAWALAKPLLKAVEEGSA
jgi:hypothetical protein